MTDRPSHEHQIENIASEGNLVGLVVSRLETRPRAANRPDWLCTKSDIYENPECLVGYIGMLLLK